MTPLSRARVATCLAAVAVVGGSEAVVASPARAGDGSLLSPATTDVVAVAPNADVDALIAATVDAVGAASPSVGGTTVAAPSAPSPASASAAVGAAEADTAAPPETTAGGAAQAGSSTSPSPGGTTPAVGAVPDGAAPRETDQPSGPIAAAIGPRSALDTTVPQIAVGSAPAGAATRTGAAAATTSASETADTGASGRDTSADTGSDGHATTTPSSSTAQSAPSNVNVSVRIGSPGDAGPVTQVNLAATLSDGVTGAAPPSGAQVVPGGTAAGSGSTTPSPATGPGTASSSTEDSGMWAWQWDCLSAPDFTAISSGVSGTGYLPMNWTWIWNCGDNPGQYQGATSSQYRPSNVNVSIRIASPGADGAVTQSNVAVAVGSGTGAHTGTSATTVPQPAPPVIPAIPGVPLPLPDIPAIVAAVSAPVSVALSPSITVTAPLIEHGVEALPVLVGTPASIDEQLDVPFVPALVGTPLVALPTGFSPDPLAAVRAGRVSPASTSAAVGAVGTHAELGALTSGEASGRAGTTPPDHRRGRDTQRPRWHAPVPQPAPESAPSATSAAPATGGGSSSGGIPIFLALPFLAAMLDLARRVVLDGTALPSGHRSHMPDDPG